MIKPVAVITGDLHMTPSNIELTTSVVRQMQAKALELGVPLVLNGDTLDTKAIIRGEVANRLIELFEDTKVRTYINTGNHDLLSEKAFESSLNFLSPYADVVSHPVYIEQLGSWVIPYQPSPEAMQTVLDTIPKGSRLIVHQGVQTAFMGAYTVDKSSLPKEAYADYRVIASHYHRAQNIKCGRPRRGAVGLFSYCGSPLTHTFGEAADGPKGFQVLYEDGTLELIRTNLRQHRIFERTIVELRNMIERDDVASGFGFPSLHAGDLLWLKVKGPKSELDRISKAEVTQHVMGSCNYKLELIPIDSTPLEEDKTETQTGEQVLDSLIDHTGETDSAKAELKALWREIL